MAVREIVLYPDEPLKQKAPPFEAFGEDVKQLAEDLLDSLHGSDDGVGLAAPQIGISRRMFVYFNPSRSIMS